MIQKEKTSEDKLYDYLIGKYKKAVITKGELALELGVSNSTIDQYLARNEGLPPYKKLGTAKNSRVVFNLFDVAKFLDNTVATHV
jgi:predicted DNA-binding transcriptional regulator AlpA